MEEAHVPVIPNINMSNKKQRKNIFDGDKEAEQQSLPRKKIDILDIETQKTDEETKAKKEDNNLSWIIIALVIVVVILLIAIIYYILTKNLDKASPVPPEIVKPHSVPHSVQHQMAQMAQQMHNLSISEQQAHKVYQAQEQASQNKPDAVDSFISRPKMYVEPTKEELDDVLERAQHQTDSVEENSGLAESENDKENTMSKNIENLIFDEDFSDDNGNINYINPNEIDEFHNQVINEES